MSLPTSIAIYFIIWWVVLFTHKLAWTTIIAGIVFALWYVVYSYRLIALDDLAALLGIPLR